MTTYRDYTQVGGWWRGSLPIVYKLSGRLAEWLKGFTKSTNKNLTQRFVITTKSIALGSIRSHYTPSTVLVVEPPVRRVYVATYVSWAVGTTTVFTLSRRPTQFEADGIPYPLPSEQREDGRLVLQVEPHVLLDALDRYVPVAVCHRDALRRGGGEEEEDSNV